MADIDRRLASVRKVRELRAIEGADRIELALVDGWQCVVRKGELRAGELGVYFEIDSFLSAADARFEFLRKGGVKRLADGSEGYRLRTVKLRGQLSQGLLLPVKDFPEVASLGEGDDATSLLDVRKYEPPIPPQCAGVVKGPFPSHTQRTDQERVQNVPTILQDHPGMEWEVTEKLDGSSCTMFLRGGEFGVCSRNLELERDEANTLWRLAIRNDVEGKLRAMGRDLSVQGEVIGEGINKNPYRLFGQHLYVFDVFDVEAGRKLLPDERRPVVEGLGLPHVPIIVPRARDSRTHAQLLRWVATLPSVLNPSTAVEGVVFKSHSLVGGSPLSFKVVNDEKLLEEEG